MQLKENEDGAHTKQIKTTAWRASKRSSKTHHGLVILKMRNIWKCYYTEKLPSLGNSVIYYNFSEGFMQNHSKIM